MRRGALLLLAAPALAALAGCAEAPATDAAALAQANMMAVEGAPANSQMALAITACVVNNATELENARLAQVTTREQMDAVVEPILLRPGYEACILGPLGGGGA